MKNFKLYVLAMSLLTLVVACGGDDDTSATPSTPSTPSVEEGVALGDISNSWKLISVNDVEPEFTVYVQFDRGLFYMYQQIYSLNYVVYEGSYNIKHNIVNGRYDNGDMWKCSYMGELSQSGDILTMISQEKYPITNVYEVCEIPAEVIKGAETRSFVDFNYHF